MKNLLRLMIAVLAVWYATPVRASHIEAGDLTYQCIGPHQYKVTLTLYRDCNGIALPDTARINYSSATCGVSSSIILNRDTPIVNVTDTCPGHNSACHGGSGFGVERHTYTGVLNLPSGCGTDWLLSFRNCARNAAITTINNPGNTCFYIKATLNNTLSQCDHSPTFLKDPVAFTCLGQLDLLNQGGYDSDGDSLVYSLVASESAANTPVIYQGAYSAANPLSVTGTFGFNTSTGQMTFTPNITQVGIMKVLVSEYRGGVLIGTVERDMQVVVQNCSDSVPQLSNVSTASGSATMLSATTVLIQPCTTGCFTIASATTNADTSIHLAINWTGQNNVPGATFNTTAGRTPTATFCWTPGRSNAGSHNIFVTVKDNACPNPGQATKTYTIIVPQVYPAGRDTTICQYNVASMRGTDTAAGSWTAMSANPVTTSILTPASPITIITGFSVAGRYNYIWTESNGACGDTMSVFVTAKPNAGVDQTICQYGTLTMAASGSGRWTTLSNNPATTTITDTTSASTTVTGFTVQGNYNYVWTSNGCTDTMRVTVTTKPNAGPDQTICGSTGSVVMAATGSGVWAAAAGNPAATTITTPASATTTVTGLIVSGTYTYYWGYGCNDTVQIIVSLQPDGGPDQSICQGGAVTMAGSGAGTWAAVAGNPAATVIANAAQGNTAITGFTAAGVYAYTWSLGGTCVDTVRITVTGLPNAGPDQTVCQYNTAVMAATGTGTWTALASNPATTTFSNSTSATTMVSGLTVAGVYNFVWAQNSCTDTVKITVTAKPNAGADQTTCQYSTATMAAAGTGAWTAAAGNPAVVSFANNTSATTSVSGFSVAGIYALYWSSNGCSDTALVTVNAKPNAGADQTVCQYNSATMAATGSGTWSAAVANPAMVAINSLTSATTAVGPFATAGVYAFYWTNNGCSDTVLINVTAKPNAGVDQRLCAPGTITTAAAGTGVWSALGNNPAATTIATPASAATIISGFTAGGTYSYAWTMNDCTDTMSVFVTPVNFAGPDQTACQYSSVTTTAFGSGAWSQLASNPATTVIANVNADTTTIGGLTVAGVYTFIWTNSLCADTMQVTVIAKPDAGADQSICQYGTATMTATGAGVWSAIATNPATMNFANSNAANTTVSGFATAGSYGLIWSAGGCSDTVVVTVNAKPNAGADQTICQYNAATLSASGSGTWTAGAGNPAAVSFSSVSDPVATVSGFGTAGVYTLLWSSGGCADTVLITVTAKPDAGADQTFCLPGTITTNATGAGAWSALLSNPAATTIASPNSAATVISGFSTGGMYRYVWTVNGCTDTMGVYIIPLSPAGPDQTTCQYTTVTTGAFGIGGSWVALAGNPAVTTFANANQDTTVVSGFSVAGSYGYVWTVNGCADTIYVTVTAKPDAGSDQTICQYSTTAMSANGSGTWTAAVGNPASVSFANASSATSVVTGFSVAGSYTFYWSNNGCSDTVVITVNAKPNAGSDQTICQYTSTALAASGAGVWTAEAANPAIVSFSNNSSATAAVSGFSAAGVYALYWSSGGCSDTVLITVTAKPNAGADQVACQNSTATLSASGVGTWTTAAGNPATLTITPATAASASVTGLTGTGIYTLYWSNGGCSDTMTITVVPSGSVSLAGTAICPGQPATLAAQVTVPGGSYSWSTGVAADTTASVTVSPATSTTYTVTYTLPVCGAYTASALVTVYPPLTLTQKNDTICTGSSAILTATPNTAGGTYAWTPGGNTTTAITVSPTAQTVYTATYSLAGCLPMTVNDTVFVTIPPVVDVNDTSVCAGNAAMLTATVSQAGGTYTWSPGGATTQSVTVSPLTTTTYTVSYAIPLPVCPPVTASGTVTVTPQPALTVRDTAVCDGHSALLTATPNVSGGSWLWSPVGAATQTVTVTPAGTTSYGVTYTVPGCGTATATETVTVNANPTVSVKGNNITCYGYTDGYITASATPAGSYQYVWSNGSTEATDSNLAAGSYSLQITDANGCTASAAAVTITEPAQAYALVLPADTTVLQGDTVQLESGFTGYAASAITGYAWAPVDGLSCSDCPAPLLNTVNATDTLNIYTVTITYNNGCMVMASDTVHVEAGTAVGNAFTPNGDGKNDVFYILARGVAEYHMNIYDRWGQLVYESTDPAAGWDGTYKGQPQAAEIYSYFLAIQFKNGQKTQRSGTITLIR